MKNKKLIIFILIIVTLFIIFLFLYNKKISYEYVYKLNKYEIKETFNKETNIFTFNVNDEYNFSLLGNYSNKRGLITDVSMYDNCLKLKGYLSFFNICKKEDVYYFSESTLEETKYNNYDNLKIYNLLDYTYLIWNYDGFYYINNDVNKKINLFETDVYSPSLIKQIDDYLFIPNYDEKYYFKSYYLLNMKDGKVKQINLKQEISFDIKYLDYENGKLNIYDKKNNKIFKVKLTNGEEKVKQKIVLTDKELAKYDVSNKYFFINQEYLTYKLKDFEVKLDNFKPKSLIYENSYESIFLNDKELIYFNLKDELIKLIEYSEWQFNYENLIFIYNKN